MISEISLVNIISNMGFPIAMVFWFMFRTEKIIRDNTQAMVEIANIAAINREIIKKLYDEVKR